MEKEFPKTIDDLIEGEAYPTQYTLVELIELAKLGAAFRALVRMAKNMENESKG